MFKNLKLSMKMAAGFGVLIVIAGILGLVGWMGIGQITDNIDAYKQGNQALENLNKCATFRRDFAINAFAKDKDGRTASDKWLDSHTQLTSKLNEMAGSSFLSSSDKDLVNSCLAKMDTYKGAFNSVLKYKQMRDEAFEGWAKSGGALFAGISEARTKDLAAAFSQAQSAKDVNAMAKLAQVLTAFDEQVNSSAVDVRLSTRYLLVKTDEEQWNDYLKKFNKAKEAVIAWKAMVAGNAGLEAAASKLLQSLDQYASSGENFYKGMLGKESSDKEMAVAAAGIVEGINKLQTSLQHALQSLSIRTNMIMITMAISGIVLGIIMAIVITRSIVRPINQIITGLTEGAQQVASASNQVSAASQSLAEGATEQAAGLEETSSSLEEMSSMTKQNAENAQQAAGLANQSRTSAQSGADAMKRMNQAINQIQKSSDETAKIIKVIDEIAFQTNLLALNAAVEAARAGEAGKGFAVVAEEVRNLAMRSAEAAKNTSAMIEDSVKNSKNGVDITNEVAKVLDEIVHGVSKTADLVNEIAASSSEQAKGIDQVNVAVAQMDKVTQSNAANAEESASASEELNAQAQSMNEIVSDLVVLVGGAHARTDSVGSSAAKTQKKSSKLGVSDQTFHHIIESSVKKNVKVAKASAHETHDAKKMIPLEAVQDDLKDFNS